MKYFALPFKDFATECKPYLSGVDVAYDIENIKSALELAQDFLIDNISEDIYELAIKHYESGVFNTPNQQNPVLLRYDRLTKYVQAAIVNFGFYYNIDFNAVRISNAGITRKDEDGEKTAYKYQVDNLKDSLLKIAHLRMNKLIEHLNGEKTYYTIWAAESSYNIDDKIYINDKFYNCNTAHTSSIDFATDIANWDEIDTSFVQFINWEPATDFFVGDKIYQSGVYYICNVDHISSSDFATDIANWDVYNYTEVVYNSWSLSQQYSDSINLIFESYKDFQRNVDINNSAFFYFIMSNIINDVIIDDIESRLQNFDELLNRIRYKTTTDEDDKIIRIIKKAVANKAFSKAIINKPYYLLPDSIRFTISNEFLKTAGQTTKDETRLKENIAGTFSNEAQQWFEKLDAHLNSLQRIEKGDIDKKRNKKLNKKNNKFYFPGT